MPAAKNKIVIIVEGPTAVGKTSVAIALAKHFKTEIISADSRQCYKELSIGVARPSAKELEQIKHHFIASHSIRDEINAAGFEQYALKKTDELFEHHDKIVMVGGTGLYIKAFCEGLDEIPPVDAEIRKEINSKYEKNGLPWLQEEVRTKDPGFYEVGETQNPQRMLRALEVVESTGKSILHFRKGKKAERGFSIIKIGLELPKEQLHDNIHQRTDKMIEEGLVQEVKGLQPHYKLNALQTVGYSEIFDYLNGKISLSEAIRNIKTNTRRYAKRQMTWFRKDKEVEWFAPGDAHRIISYIESIVNSR
ncbi:MAG TPA: tRNA (adenosine(37)-N6)-dimethylallyltransferase MiaA [Chitinophagaceae bacterium]|nr:tRNA (adenosine(37)-N6)-dimethylallyltransferase MiaA [Chitinophagaceae bacterium]